jgi:hypothetical protein
MEIGISDSTTAGIQHSMPLSTIRWTAILAGLVVGLATHLLLMLLGTSIGLAAVDVGDEVGGATIPVAAGAWNTVSMIIAAFVGAYVAARSAGMRRASDGMLHGVVSWGLTMLLTAFLATTAAGALVGSIFGSPTARSAAAQSAPAASQTARSIAEGDRAEAIQNLQSRLGISSEQAGKLVDQALIMAGREESASPAGQEAAQDTLRTASMASGWLTGAILLSLLAAIAGGWLGARGTHRHVRTAVHRGPPTTPTDTATIVR